MPAEEAVGVDPLRAERWQAITSLLKQAIGARAPMLQDVEARRQTEIDVVNGAIFEAGGGILCRRRSTAQWSG